MTRLVALALLVPTLAGAAVPLEAQQPATPFVTWARAHAVPLPNDFRGLDSVIGNARVVALGEPAHGAHEPLAFRNALFRYLVEHRGFTAIALESGFPESRRVADFVAGGPGVADEIVRYNLTWGFGSFEENVQLVRWMRAYNADPAHRRKVRFYGIDVSMGGPGGGAPTPGAIHDALSFLTRVDAAAANRMAKLFQPYLGRLPVGASSFSAAQRDGLSAAIDSLVAVLRRGRTPFVAATSERDYAWALHDAVAAQQADGVFDVMPAVAAAGGGGIPPDAWRAENARNSAMAANVLWALARQGQAGKLLVYTHNGHIKNAPTEGGVWSAFARPPEVMGEHLRAALGSDLFIIGTSSAVNGAGLPSTAADAGSIDAALARVGPSRFLVDLRAARGDSAVAAWLTQRHHLRANFTTFMVLAPGAAFDALLFIDSLTPAHIARPPE